MLNGRVSGVTKNHPFFTKDCIMKDMKHKCPYATHVLHLRCNRCCNVDLVLCKDAKNWKCLNCNIDGIMEWVKCSDRLPEIENVLVIDVTNDIFVAYFSKSGSCFINCNCREGSTCSPTHWMPLPELPKDEE